MQISQREAAALLDRRLWIPRRAATRLLQAGLAGSPERVAGTLLYEREAVEALTRRPGIDRATLPDECAGAILLARTTDTADPLGAATGPARFSLVTRSLLRLLRPEGQDWLPLVVTLDCRAPGPWFDTAFAGRVVPSTAGNPHHLWISPRTDPPWAA